MQIQLTPEQHAKVAEIALHQGGRPEDLMKATGMGIIEENTRFRAAVRLGIEAADRGEFLEPAEVWARIEKILQA